MSGRWNIAGMALIFGATLLAYLPAIHGGLLWDDDAHVTKAQLQSLAGLRRIWFELGATQQYYPMLHSAFWIEHRLWGDAVVGYHLANIFLHAVAACLVVVIVRRLFSLVGPGSDAAAGPGLQRLAGVEWLSGLVFALHPVCVESVAWISEQKNTLSAVFCLSAAWAYLEFDRKGRRSLYWVASGLFVLALLSKTVTATLPAALLVIFWWRQGRSGLRRNALPMSPWLALGAAGGLFTAWVERKYFIDVQLGAGGRGTEFSLSILERCLLASRAVLFYLGKLIWPANLTFMYPRWNVDATVWWQYLFPIGLLAGAAGLVWLAGRHRGPLAGFLVFAGTLFPALGFVDVYPFRYTYVADHFQYLASLGVIVPLAAGWVLAARSLQRHLVIAGSWAAAVIGGLLPVSLGILAHQDAQMYRDSESLYRETLARNPACWLAHANLALLLEKTPGGAREALAHLEAAVRLRPDSADIHNYLGSALAGVPGRRPEALVEFESALRINPDSPYANFNEGAALMDVSGRLPEALVFLEKAVRLAPGLAEAHNALGSALARLPGRQPEAIAEFGAALKINPDFADAHSNLAIALADIPGRMSEAIGHFEQVVRLNPDSAAAHYNLGCVLAKISRNGEALAEFEEALRIEPGNESARQWIGRLAGGGR